MDPLELNFGKHAQAKLAREQICHYEAYMKKKSLQIPNQLYLKERNRVSINSDCCTGCGTCVQTCPTGVFRLNSSGRAEIRYPDYCLSCLMCVIDCPADAITITPEKMISDLVWWR